MNAPAVPAPAVSALDPGTARRLLFALTRGEPVSQDEAARACFPRLPQSRHLLLSVDATGQVSCWDSLSARDAGVTAGASRFTLELTQAQWDDLLVMTRAAYYTVAAGVTADVTQEVA